MIIPIHDATRPLRRVVESLARSGLGFDELRVLVVCHNISEESIRPLLAGFMGMRVDFLEYHDGLRSPAGPRAFALESTTSEYFSFVDSDDLLEDGALQRWRSLADRHHLDAVIPRERHASGRRILTPPTRPLRSSGLDASRDRLMYRTAPLGLLRRESAIHAGVCFGDDVTNGSDQIFGLTMWFGSTRLRYDRRGPAYVVGDDAETRVTRTAKPLDAELKASVDVLRGEWFSSRASREQQLIATKFVRIHLFDGVTSRLQTGDWTAGDHDAAARFLGVTRLVAPGHAESLGRAEMRLYEGLERPACTTEELSALATARRRFLTPAAMFTPRLRNVFRRDAPVRFSLASLLS